MRGPAISMMLGASTRCWRPASRLHEICLTFAGGSFAVLVTATVSADVAASAACNASTPPSTGMSVPLTMPVVLPEGTQAPTTRYPALGARRNSLATCAIDFSDPTNSTRVEYSPCLRWVRSHWRHTQRSTISRAAPRGSDKQKATPPGRCERRRPGNLGLPAPLDSGRYPTRSRRRCRSCRSTPTRTRPRFRSSSARSG